MANIVKPLSAQLVDLSSFVTPNDGIWDMFSFTYKLVAGTPADGQARLNIGAQTLDITDIDFNGLIANGQITNFYSTGTAMALRSLSDPLAQWDHFPGSVAYAAPVWSMSGPTVIQAQNTSSFVVGSFIQVLIFP